MFISSMLVEARYIDPELFVSTAETWTMPLIAKGVI